MAGTLQFNRKYAEFGSRIRDFEKDDEVGFVVSEFLWYDGAPFYPVGAVIDAHVSAVWLGEGDAPTEDLIDLVFRMRPSPNQDFTLYEIVLRDQGGAFYGGWVFGDNLRVTDEVVNGHRVLETDDLGATARFVFVPTQGQYQYDGSPIRATTARARSIAKRRR